jgi:DNA replicative helicase MCM subunit Mcm2 (Cdc46/Mcm family)
MTAGHQLNTIELKNKLEEFLDEYLSGKIENVANENKENITVSFNTLLTFDYTLAEAILDHPDQIITMLNKLIYERCKDKNNNYSHENSVSIRFIELPESCKVELRSFRAKDNINFVSLQGTVKLKSNLMNLITHAKFECPSCGNIIKMEQDITEELKTPSGCKCGRKGKFLRIGDDLIDFYYIDLEEPMEIIDDSNKPVNIRCWLKGGLNKKEIYRNIIPGSKVQLNGYFKLRTKRLKGKVVPLVEKFFEVNSVDFLQETFEDLDFDEGDVEAFKEIARRDDWLDFLRNELFKDIKGHDMVCKAVILQMIGGVKVKKKTGIDIRGNAHILLVGVAGSSKSSILKTAQKFAPKAKYVAGSAVSGVGLIGAVVRNDFDNSWEVQAGAFSLSNKGMLMVDELDKISHDNKQAMHEPLSEECYAGLVYVTNEFGEHLPFGSLATRLAKKKGVDLEEDAVEFESSDDLCVPTYSFSGKETMLLKSSVFKIFQSPEVLYEVTFTNGHVLKVTPDHPLFIVEDGVVTTVKAKDAVPGLVVPVADRLSFSPSSYALKDLDNLVNMLLAMKISDRDESLNRYSLYPNDWDEGLATLVGFFLRSQVNVSDFNTTVFNEDFFAEIKKYLEDVFGVYVYRNVMNDEEVLLRVKDELFSNWMHYQFPFFFGIKDKKIPSVVFGNDLLAEAFLRGVFQGTCQEEVVVDDFFVAMQLQTLLLVKGKRSVIENDEENEFFKVKILNNGDEVKIKFIKKIVSSHPKVYDINVPMTHNFISHGGLLLHNTISFSKAGVDQVLPAEVSVLAAANPVHGSFSSYDPIFSQIDMTTTLFNRFDLVFIFNEESKDQMFHEELAQIVIDNSNKGLIADRDDGEKALFFKKYISYAKTFQPMVGKDVSKFLANYYGTLKIKSISHNEGGKKPIPITLRNMDALRRLSQAVARSRFHAEVTREDAALAIEFLNESFKQVGLESEYSPTTFENVGDIDLEDPISGSKSKISKGDAISIVKQKILGYYAEYKKPISHKDLEVLCANMKLKPGELDEYLTKLKMMGDIFSPNYNKYQPAY